MRSILSALLLIAAPAFAQDMVARIGDSSVRLTQEPCPVSVIKIIPEGTRGHYHLASVRMEGKQYVACWAYLQQGIVLLTYEDGDRGLIPMDLFKPEPGA